MSECKHGQLQRQCQLCEYEERIRSMEETMAADVEVNAQLHERIRELEHAIRDAEITLCNDRYDVRIGNALATLREVLGDE